MDIVKTLRNKLAAFIMFLAMSLHAFAMNSMYQLENGKMFRSTAGEASAKAMVALVVGLTVALIIIGYVLPVGFQGYHAINKTLAGLTTQESSMYDVLGIFAMIAILLALIATAVKD